jgi:hypothetical protein
LEPTFYFRDGGHLAARVSGSYDLLLTQRLVAQPELEMNFYSKQDPEHGIRRGLSDIDTGIRLRYEFSPKFAPYVGFAYGRTFPLFPRLAAVGSFLLILMACTTLSFLVTTPEAWVPALGDTTHDFPYLSGAGRLISKDVIILGAAVVTMADSAKAYLSWGPDLGRFCVAGAAESGRLNS